MPFRPQAKTWAVSWLSTSDKNGKLSGCCRPFRCHISYAGRPFGQHYHDLYRHGLGTVSRPYRTPRRVMSNAPDRLYPFFGSRTPGELPYFGPLKKIPINLLDQELVFSRLPDEPKEYMKGRMLKPSTCWSAKSVTVLQWHQPRPCD